MCVCVCVGVCVWVCGHAHKVNIRSKITPGVVRTEGCVCACVCSCVCAWSVCACGCVGVFVFIMVSDSHVYRKNDFSHGLFMTVVTHPAESKDLGVKVHPWVVLRESGRSVSYPPSL